MYDFRYISRLSPYVDQRCAARDLPEFFCDSRKFSNRVILPFLKRMKTFVARFGEFLTHGEIWYTIFQIVTDLGHVA